VVPWSVVSVVKKPVPCPTEIPELLRYSPGKRTLAMMMATCRILKTFLASFIA